MPNLKNIKAPYSKTVVLRANRQQNAQQHRSNTKATGVDL